MQKKLHHVTVNQEKSRAELSLQNRRDQSRELATGEKQRP